MFLGVRSRRRFAVCTMMALIRTAYTQIQTRSGRRFFDRRHCRTSWCGRLGISLVIAVVICSALLVGAQQSSGSENGGRDYGFIAPGGPGQSGDIGLDLAYFRGYLTDTKNVVASALPWRPSDWLKVSLVVGATLMLADEDEDIQSWLQGRRGDDSNLLAELGKPLGDGRYALPALGLLYCYGRFSGNDRVRRTALLGVESAVVSGAITGAIKYVSHKHRPTSSQVDDIPWGGPAFSAAHLSFPSGHSACAFAISTVVATEYRDNAFVPPFAYGAAALCAFSRLNDNAHWLSDVVVGSLIGHFTARAIVARRGCGTANQSRFRIGPHITDRSTGLSLSYSF